jgi:Domain of unknown function (DUF4214)
MTNLLPRLNYKNLTPEQTVEAIYQLMLNRSIDPIGEITWKSAIEKGTYSRIALINATVLSDEFLSTFHNISRSNRVVKTLSMLRLLKMENASPTQQCELIYRFMLNRKIDESGRHNYTESCVKQKFPALRLIYQLIMSTEFKQPYCKYSPASQLHRARMAWVKQLPEAKYILDIGGSSPTMPEGALMEMGYAHKPEVLVIFDKPPHEQFWGTPNYSQANTRSFDWGQVQYIHGYAEDILKNEALREQKFDMIYMGQVVEHIFEDRLPIVLNWIKDHLTDSGAFCFDTPNRLITRVQTGEGAYIDPDHKREYTPQEFTVLLATAGFSIKQQWGILNMPNVVKSQTVGAKDYYDGEQLSPATTDGYCFAMKCQVKA